MERDEDEVGIEVLASWRGASAVRCFRYMCDTSALGTSANFRAETLLNSIN